jgi:hypothetical protein
MGCVGGSVAVSETNDEKPRHLIVRSQDGQMMTLNVKGVPTVREIQDALAAATGRSVDNVIVTRSGNELRDGDAQPCKPVCGDVCLPSLLNPVRPFQKANSLDGAIDAYLSPKSSKGSASSRNVSKGSTLSTPSTNHCMSPKGTSQPLQTSQASNASCYRRKGKPQFLMVACCGPYHGFGNNAVRQTGYGPNGDWCKRCDEHHRYREEADEVVSTL